jgi:phospholipid/cholesterol/gamma-HCH transport system substrate-binding protein
LKISKEVRVGTFAVLTITILYFGFNYLKGIDFFNKSEKYYVIYSDVAGLTVSNPVKISGYTVGRVSNISINQQYDNSILVEMDVDQSIIIGDSTIALLDVDLLGSVSIILNIGDISKPLLPGDTVFARVDPTLNELLKSTALPVADNLQITIRRLNSLLSDFAENSENLKRTIANTADITEKTNAMLGENRVKIKESISNFNKVSRSLDERMDDLGILMSKYGGVADSIMGIDMQSTLNNASEMMKTMNETLLLLQDENGTIGRFMKDDSVYVSLNKTLIDLDLLLIHMNENPKHFFGPLGKSQKKIEKDLRKQAKKSNE